MLGLRLTDREIIDGSGLYKRTSSRPGGPILVSEASVTVSFGKSKQATVLRYLTVGTCLLCSIASCVFAFILALQSQPYIYFLGIPVVLLPIAAVVSTTERIAARDVANLVPFSRLRAIFHTPGVKQEKKAA